MATKYIKLTNNNGTDTYVPVTVASAVQYSYADGAMSVQQAIGTLASSQISIAEHLHDQGSDLQTLTGSSTGSGTSGVAYINLSDGGQVGIYNASTASDAAVTLSYTNGKGIGIKVSNTNQTQWLNVNDGTAGFNPEVRLDNNGTHGKYKINGSAATTGYADVYVSYATGTGITISAKYTDTNNKVDVSNSNTSKLYVTGAANSGNTTLSYDSNIYLETTPGHIHATQFNGALNGSITSSTTATTQSTTDDSTKVATTAFVHDVVDGALTAALKYKGVLNSQSDLPTATANTVGHVYVVKTAGDYTVDHDANGTATSNHLETGDYVIGTYIGTSYVWVPVNGENQWTIVSNPELPANGTPQDLLTIEGQTLTLKHGTPTGTTKNATKGTDGSQLTHNSSFVLTGINWKADANGHVTEVSYTRAKLPADNNTHYSSYNIFGAQNGMANSQQSNGNVHLRHIEGDSTNGFSATSTHKVTGTGTTSAYTDASGNLTIYTPADVDVKVLKGGTNVTTYVNVAAGTGSATANTNEDTLTLTGANYWINVNASSKNVNIAHALASTAANASTLYKTKIDPAGHSYDYVAVSSDSNLLASLANNYKLVEGNTITDLDPTFLSNLGLSGTTGNNIVTGTATTTKYYHE